MQVRQYQEDAINAFIPWLKANKGKNGLYVLATGTGKSYIQARILELCHNLKPTARFMCATHQQDLIQGNYDAFIELMPQAQVGIYSAGLARKDTTQQFLFTGIQSAVRCPYDFGFINILFVDEAHTISNNDTTMWRKFIAALRDVNPNLIVIGLSATPFRLDSGNLTTGENAMFDDIIYEYGIMDGINDGYLSPLLPKQGHADIDFSESHLKKHLSSNGDFKESYLNEVLNKPNINAQVVDEIIRHGSDRKTWMIFCSSVEHAEEMTKEIQSRGISCVAVTAKTKNRKKIYRDLKEFKIRAACSVGVMTTGTNIPNIDLIAFVRKTLSGGLLVQMAGRGTRVIYEAGAPLNTPEERKMAIYNGPKRDCLVLDFVGNIQEHGPIDKITGRDKKQRESDGPSVPPMKECPKCQGIIMASNRVCEYCGHEFPAPEPNINPIADTVAVLSNQMIVDKFVPNYADYSLHRKKGDPDKISLRIKYVCGLTVLNEWVKVDPSNYHFRKWWSQRSKLPMPRTVEEAVCMGESLRLPSVIHADISGKYANILRHEFAEWPEESQSLDLDKMFLECEQDDLLGLI